MGISYPEYVVPKSTPTINRSSLGVSSDASPNIEGVTDPLRLFLPLELPFVPFGLSEALDCLPLVCPFRKAGGALSPTFPSELESCSILYHQSQRASPASIDL
jgi:hypothetical protein